MTVVGFGLGVGFQQARIASLKAEHAQYQVQVQEATIKSQAAFIAYHSAVQSYLTISRDQYDTDIQKLQADLVVAGDIRERLLERLRYLSSLKYPTIKQAPTIGQSGPSERDRSAFDLFINMFDRHSRELVSVGNYADRLKAAGLKCERDSDAWSQQSLTTSPVTPAYNSSN